MKPYGWTEKFFPRDTPATPGAPTRLAAVRMGSRQERRRDQAKAARRAVPGLVQDQLAADAD
jgi:hypothetical protein